MTAKPKISAGRGRRGILLAGIALAALGLAGSTGLRAHAAGVLSQGGGETIAPVPSSITANLLAQQQGAAVAAQAQDQLARITTALQAMQTMQTAAHNLALTTPSSVPDGLQTGGLVPDSGLAAPGVANPVTTWTGANTPTQTSSAGKTTVTINQTAAQALLSWNSFNVSPGTTVDFNQQGNTDWVALNQIAASGTPSQILGSIKASGQVYLINPNGIIFGASSQINVGALIASSAEISDSQFLDNGIYSTETGTGSQAVYAPSFTNAGGTISVQAGAEIVANGPSTVTNGGGYVLLMGTQVNNGGSISTPQGQAELAAGDNFILRQGVVLTTSDSITTSSTAGNEVAVQLKTLGSSVNPGGSGSGLVVNTGEITADTGDITLAGETVDQDGVLLATTSTAYRGTIHLLSAASDPYSSVTLGTNGYTLIEPDLTSTTTELDGQRTTLIADSATADAERAAAFNAQFDDLSQLGDQQDESRIEIVTGGSVEFQDGSDSSAPGGQIAVSAVSRIQADTGAIIDVSGSYAVPMAMSSNDIEVNIQSEQLRDDPQNRLTGALDNANVYVDANTLSLVPASAAYASDRDYTAGGLLEVSGELSNVKHTIGEYTALGGSIDLSTGANGAIVAETGSTFNIDGGSLQYQGGYLQQSYLVGSNGQIYNVNNAPANITYTGVYNGFTVAHPNWGVTQSYGNALNTPSEVYEPGYTVGRAAGSLTLSSPTTIFDGSVEAGTVNGPQQIAADPAGVTDPYLLTQNEVAAAGSLNIGTLSGSTLLPGTTDVSFGTSAPDAVGLTTPIPTDVAGTTIFNAGSINNFGLGGLNIITNGSIDIAAPLVLTAGANVSLYGGSVDIGADLTDPGGSVTAGQVYSSGGTQFTLGDANGTNNTGDTVLAPGAAISTAGLWTNIALDPDVTFTQAYINGGAVTLGSVNNLTLGAGSVIDTSAGGVISANGGTKGGAGGNISLAAATPSNAIPFPTGDLTLGGTLDAIGATSGGALSLSAPSFLISAAQSADAGAVSLDPAFFTQGFSAYNLTSTGNITVAPGTVVNVTEPTYQFTAASQLAQTGSAPAAALTVALAPLYTPNSTYTAITQRAGASFSANIVSLTTGASVTNGPVLSIGAGAAVTVDPSQSIKLAATGQITVDGALTAPGGTISAISDFNTFAALPGGPGTTSIWLGQDSVIDASAAPVTFTDAAGGMISLAPAGGSITLGNKGSTAAVIIQAGAVVEASGSAATDEIAASTLAAPETTALPAGQPIAVEGAGGAISLASQEGIYNDGTLIAAAGGPNAAGGSLSMTIEADQVLSSGGIELTPRIFTITQDDPGALLPPDLQPGESSGLTAGTAQISAQQIAAGGFGNVALYTRDAFVFQGNVTLNAAQSISLEEGYITDSSPAGVVALNAPYVLLSGQTPDINVNGSSLAAISGFSAQTATGTFTVNAALIDIASEVRFGGVLPAEGSTPAVDLAGFASVNLNSSGDLRFDAPNTSDAGADTNLVTTANLNLTAREIYAQDTSNSISGTGALIVAGYAPGGSPGNGGFNPNGVLTIARTAGTTPEGPDMIGGSLTFEAATIKQGGVIWQPLGSLTFGGINQFIGDNIGGGGDPNTVVDFLAGSITSVSAAGLTIPFGGTTDGVTYDVDGQAIASKSSATFGLQGVTNGAGTGTITIAALTTDVQSGAELDLAGGGTLTGAGFISGEGGSSDALTTPLLKVGTSSVTQPGLASDPVYAIVAGPQQPVQAVAYTASGATGSTPALGAQIVIPAGVPGLPAGTYTLLPAQYALTPGGYRVEFDGAASLTANSVAALPNGSYAVAGFTAVANTAIQNTLASNLTITPGATVLNYSQYNQESYSQYLIATATRLGGIRPALPVDAGNLVLNLPANAAASLTNAGTTLFDAAAGGEGGTLTIAGAGFSTPPSLDIFGAAPVTGLAPGTVSLSAAQIDAFHASTIELGDAGAGFNANTEGVTLENGATLTAARVVITALAGGITLNDGSEINTLGQGTLLADSTTFGLFTNGGASVLDVGNGYLSYSSTPGSIADYGPITVQDGATIYTEGSIAFSTSASVNIGVNATYGGKYLDLAVPEINIGDPASLGATAPSGLLLTQAVLQTLTHGVPAIGVPALQTLVLTASDSLNLYGTTALDLTGSNVQLVINTPAIYGFGGASDVATISADTIVWNGLSTLDQQSGATVSSLPGGAVTNGPGSGTGSLDLVAQNIVFGYSDLDEPLRDVPLNRLTLGFSTVNLDASTAITANNQGTLAVYASQPVYGQAGTGGTLNLTAPLLTAANAATIGFIAGGDINVAPAAGVNPAQNLAGVTAGGEVDLTGADIDIASSVILPSGKLDLQATNDITLTSASLVNLAGVTTKIADATTYGFGGDLVMQSANGNITQAAGSVIDVAATDNNAGSVTATATNTAGGQVSLLGTLTGGSTGGYNSGSFTVSAQSLGDFAALNASLDAGQFDQSRSFDIKQGDLTIGNGVQAHNVSVSVDGGSLTVNGLINASGNGGGNINLAATDNLILASTADLDAHGTVLQVDSNNQAIPSENTPAVSLTASTGELTLATGATLDLASADGTARGDLELNVPRLGGATSGDADINAAGAVNITGAATIAVNAFYDYNGLPDPDGTVSGNPDALITQAYLDHINTTDTLPYMAAAATNTDLAARLAGLKSYGSTFHFRPGVEIVSATPDGDLTVQGDINLAAYRYGPGVIKGDYGSGEPGVLVIRAGGNLNIYGSITDGFEKPVDDAGTEFAKGWVVYGGGEPYGQAQTIPTAITVAKGTSFAIGDTPVNFAVPITGGTFQAGAVAPVALTVKGKQVTGVAFVATSNIMAADGTTVLFAQGQVVPAGTVIPNKAVIEAGGTLPFAIDVGPVTWPANTPFTVTESLTDGNTGVVLAENLQLLAGSYIPAGSALKFVAGEAGLKVPTDPNGNRLYFPDGTPVPAVVDTRPVDGGTQGQLYGLAKLLPAGDQSWSISLVAGADTSAANPDVVQSSSALAAAGVAGDITLADTHYGQTTSLITIPPLHNPSNPKNHKICEKDPASCKPTYTVNYVSVVPAYSVVRTGTGSLSLIAGGSINEDSAYGVYTAGAQSAAILVNGKNPYDLAQGYGTKTSLLGAKNTALAALVANYEANYPTGGGNVLVSAQGDLNGFISTTFAPVNSDFEQSAITDTDAVGSWLWRQGGAGQPGAWWIEYGSLNLTPGSGVNGNPDVVQYTGFQGIGTLGGGNLTVDTGGNASGLNLAVASNGRVKADGTLVQDGGGSMDVNIGGALNFRAPGSFSPYVQDAGGVIADLRGNTLLSAGSVGTIVPQFGTLAGDDPRILAPLVSETANFGNGIDLLPGDGTVTLDTRGDLVIDGAGNPGTVQNTVNSTPVDYTAGHIKRSSGGNTDFSLWSANTGIDLFSAGGDIAPVESNASGNGQNANADDYYPPNLLVTAQNGNIYFGTTPVELAPSANGQLQLLAANSIIGDASIVSMSGAALSMVATPYNPGISVLAASGLPIYTNHNPNSPGLLVDFGADTPTGALHAGDTQPALVYAGTGDILDISFGEFIPASGAAGQQVIAAKPFDIVAGRDIVDSGTIDAPDTFLNLSPTDITSITAGHDIYESSFDIAGPGNLVVQAGGDINLVDQSGANVPLGDQGGIINSIGPIFDIDPNNRNSGAGISVLAGVGADGPDYSNFADLYLNPASTLDLDNASDIIASNDATLATWLQTNYGYNGTAAGAYAYFLTLPAGPREVFLRQLYYDELNESGLEFNQPASVRYKSYILGQDAIAALFPATDGNGQPLTYTGDITMSGDSGIHTEFGGNIETMTPGGQTIIGVEGTTPPASAGFITEGSGDIDIYAQGSVLLGQSRVLTTFGGNIVIWSAAGDINAGQGSKTTIDYTPLQRVYDNYGDVFLSPTVPSSGAGIATLNPIPSVPPGDINLIAPLGTVNAGSAGIRVSGNINIAAQHVVNGANIEVQGSSTGVPTAAAPDIGALAGASNAAGASAQSAENSTGGNQAAPLPSIWIVEILGYGGGGAPVPGQCEQKKHGCLRATGA